MPPPGYYTRPLEPDTASAAKNKNKKFNPKRQRAHKTVPARNPLQRIQNQGEEEGGGEGGEEGEGEQRIEEEQDKAEQTAEPIASSSAPAAESTTGNVATVSPAAALGLGAPTLNQPNPPFHGRAALAAGLGNGRSTMRHKKRLRDNIQGVTKPAIRRLARRAGVKRIAAEVYPATRLAMMIYLETVIEGAVIRTGYRKAKTVNLQDVQESLKSINRPVWGFEQARSTGDLDYRT